MEFSQGHSTTAGSAPSDEEADNLLRSTKKVRTDGMEGNSKRGAGGNEEGNFEERCKSSYKEKVLDMNFDVVMEGDEVDLEGEVSDDDKSEYDEEDPWFSIGMTKEEKLEARRPWRLSLIIKLVGKSVGYQFLMRWLQLLWKPQHAFSLVDLHNDFFIARFSNKLDYEVALLNGAWVISDHYLHVQRWVPKFMPISAKIESLLVWVRFPILQVEFYSAIWLEKAGNRIGRKVKVDRTTLLESRGKFARVCVEIDLTKPLKAGYKIGGEMYGLQYEGLHELCFHCGKYGHRSAVCPKKVPSQPHMESQKSKEGRTNDMGSSARESTSGTIDQRKATYGEWMTVSKPRRRQSKQGTANAGDVPTHSTAKTTLRVAEKATEIKDGKPHNRGYRFSILTEDQEDINEKPEMEDPSTILEGEIQGIPDPNKVSMPQSGAGGAKLNAKRKKVKD